MLKIKLTIILAIFTISACSATHKQQDHEQDTTITLINETLYLSDATFSTDVTDGNFKSECAMLPILTQSILDSSKEQSLNISRRNKITTGQYHLKVEYINVVAHNWRFLAIRPGSLATVKASIIKDGTVIQSTTKEIGSGVAFGACDRLEKISLAEGRYIAKWVAKYI